MSYRICDNSQGERSLICIITFWEIEGEGEKERRKKIRKEEGGKEERRRRGGGRRRRK